MLIRVMLCFLGKVEGISRGIAVPVLLRLLEMNVRLFTITNFMRYNQRSISTKDLSTFWCNHISQIIILEYVYIFINFCTYFYNQNPSQTFISISCYISLIKRSCNSFQSCTKIEWSVKKSSSSFFKVEIVDRWMFLMIPN